MERICITGRSDMSDFTPWWESHLPAYVIVWCLRGEAVLTLQHKPYRFRRGMTAFIAPDMFPAFSGMTGDFLAYYFLTDRDFTDEAFYDIPGSFFNAIYAEPVVRTGRSTRTWTALLDAVRQDTDNAYRLGIMSDILHAIALDSYDKWQRQYGESPGRSERNSAEVIAMRFYDLIYDHFHEQRTTAFYADKLCITPCYLAMVTRKVYGESPKQAIDKIVTLEMKHILRRTDMTAEQMAAHLHFPDTSYMCRFFRRQTGMSLSEYRRTGGE